MDKVFIKDLEVETIIGIFGWEREVKQKVRISMEMSFDISKAGIPPSHGTHFFFIFSVSNSFNS